MTTSRHNQPSASRIASAARSRVPSATSALAQAEKRLNAVVDLLRRYAGIVSASSDLMAFVDLNLTYRAANTAFVEAFGKTQDGIVGHHLADTFGAELFETRLKPHIDSCLAGKHGHFQDWWAFPQRGRCYIDAHFEPFHAADGSPNGIALHIRDITEHKQAEDALLESEERFRNLIEGSIQGIFIHRKFKPLFVNQAFADILGYRSPKELVTVLDSLEAHHARHERERIRGYNNARLKGKYAPVQYQYDAVRKDGSMVTLQNIVRVISWEGKPAVQSTVIDVSARKKLDVLLREMQAMAKIGGWEIDLTNNALIWTDELYRIHELPVAEGITIDRSFSLFPTESRLKIEEALARAKDHGDPWDLELKKYTAKGRVIWVRTVGRAFMREGKAYRLVGTFQDITERKEAERALLESEERFRNLIEGSIQGIIIQRDWRPLFVNQAYADMLGYDSPEEILQMESIEQQFAPYERERLRQYKLARQRGDEAPSQYEYDSVCKDGSIITVQNVVRIVNWDGQPAVQSTLIDVSERKRVQAALRDSESRMQAFLDNTPAMIFVKDREGRFSLVNRRFEELFDIKEAELRGRTIHELTPGEEAEATTARDREVIERRQPVEYECKVARPDGEYVFVTVKFPIFDASGEVSAIGGVDIDITSRKRAERLLRTSERRYQALYDDNPSMFFTLDEKGTILSVNRFGAAELGYDVRQLIGKPIFVLYPENEHAAVREHLHTCFQDPDTVRRWEMPKIRRDGNVIWVRETSRVVKSVDGVSTMLKVCEDITETRDLSQQLSYQASHDTLTGLINRGEFEKRLKRALQTVRIDKTEHALCYLDLDQFKVINDTCGHIAGDELLRQLGRLLREQVSSRDTLARLGGDEFGVLVERCSLEQAESVAEALREAIMGFQFAWEDKNFHVGVSIGLVPIKGSSGSITTVLSMADSACYVAKDNGTNLIHVYHEDDKQLARRYSEMQWVSRLNRAFEEDHFELNLQPIVAVADPDNRAQCYELLVRMKLEDGRVVLPSRFLPAAERYNLAAKLDRWVIAKAFQWIGQQPQQKNPVIYHINLSGQSLGDEGILDFIIQCFDETGVPAEQICFEVTETVAIANLSNAIGLITALKQLGCRFALDDFGSGLSSFNYLRKLPVDFLKIDGTFVKDIVDDRIAYAMVRSINEIGRVMDMKTIAEFVENEAILGKLEEIGVDFVQGHAVGRPMPIVQKD